MADNPRRPILHLKFPKSEPEGETPETERPRVALPRALPIAPGRKSVTVREFTPSPAPRPMRPPRRDPPPKPQPAAWKCKPCGRGFDVPASLDDNDSVRCPACNARLGLARDFRSNPPNLEKVRARAVARA
jgi:DNA-directed RNA polymerase subunit RPC12/RpoP